MRVAVIAAMSEELAPFFDKMEILKSEIIAKRQFSKTYLNNKEVILARCGIGKVNAAVGATILNTKYKPDYIINVGSAGALPDSHLKIGNIFYSESILYHDVDLTEFGYELGQVPEMPKIFKPDEDFLNIVEGASEKVPLNISGACVATGDSFLTDEKYLSLAKGSVKIDAVEMEACSMAQVCSLFNTPFITARAISDIVGLNSESVFKENLDLAAKNVSKFTLKIMEDI